MSNEYSSKPQKTYHGNCFFLFLIIIVIGYSAIRYLVDRINYNKGHYAYIQADCISAINHFDSVINGWRLFDVGEFSSLAQQEKTECPKFQEAVDKQQAGELSDAIIAYADFVYNFKNGLLVNTAYKRGATIFKQTQPSVLATPKLCGSINYILENGIITNKDDSLPPFYLACGQAYEKIGDHENSYAMYELLLNEYPNHSVANEAESLLLINPVSCEKVDSLKLNSVIVNRKDFMPSLYINCGRTYDENGELSNSFEMYMAFLTNYPYHLLAKEAEKALLSNSVSCQWYISLQKSIISKRADFMPSLYNHCGQEYEDDYDWKHATTMYENFLENYPSHPLASEVETALARSIIEDTKTTSTGELPAPEKSGSTVSNSTEVVI